MDLTPEQKAHLMTLPVSQRAGYLSRLSEKAVDAIDPDDLVEMCRSAVPVLVKHAISLAKTSENLKDVMRVIDTLADRGYGKVQGEAQAETKAAIVNITIGSEKINLSKDAIDVEAQ